jgi:AcrR family transcriptional regulator
MSPTAEQVILERAFERFCAHGYAGTSVRQVAAAAKVSPGVVTYHYPKKDQLFRAAIELPYGRFVAELRARVEAPATSARDRLRHVIDLLGHPGDELRGLLRLLLRQVLDSVEPVAGLAPLFLQGHIALLGKVITDASEEGALPEGVGLGAMPIIFGGLILPHLLADSLRSVPAVQPFTTALIADSQRSMLRLLRLS